MGAFPECMLAALYVGHVSRAPAVIKSYQKGRSKSKLLCALHGIKWHQKRLMQIKQLKLLCFQKK